MKDRTNNPWIQNVSLDNVVTGYHYDPGPNSVLIQIVDPDMDFPIPKFNFKEVYRFKFLDLEESHEVGPKISDDQAEELLKILQHSLDTNMNVTVHCVAGVCRSGAVCEVGTMIGFEDTGTFRIPNTLVKKKMLKALTTLLDKEDYDEA